MLELCAIASGSSGNCICVGSDHTHLLIDAGVSGKRIESGLNEIALKTSEMQGILVTHEHVDHIAGLGVLARRYGIPIFATEKTINAIKNTKSVGKKVNTPQTRFSPQTKSSSRLVFLSLHLSYSNSSPKEHLSSLRLSLLRVTLKPK